MNNRLIIILAGALLLGACNKPSERDDDPTAKNLSMNLSFNALAANDPNSINQDNTFSSLAIYIYKSDAGSTLERSVQMPSFSSVGVKDIPITISTGVKILYVVANYTGKTFRLTNGTTITLSPTTTKAQLDNLTTQSSSLVANSLLMVGKQTINMTAANNGTLISVALRRLAARVDVHIYKGLTLLSNVVTLKSVTLRNQVLNSEVKFDYTGTSPQMLTSPIFNNQTKSNSSTLLPYVLEILNPANAKVIFYTYQNLSTSASQSSAPYLEIKLSILGITGEHKYKGYFTDNNQTTNKYSLRQNNVYKITAKLNLDSEIDIKLK